MRPRLRSPAGTRCPARIPEGPVGGASVPGPAETPDRSGQPQQLYPLWAGALRVLTFRPSCHGAPQKQGDQEQRDPVGSRGLWPCHSHCSYGAGVGTERSVWPVQAEGSVRWDQGRRIGQPESGSAVQGEGEIWTEGSEQPDPRARSRQRDWCSGIQAEGSRQRDPGSRIRAAAPGGHAARRGSGRAAPGAGDGRVRRSRGRRASGGRGLGPERASRRERANERAREVSTRRRPRAVPGYPGPPALRSW